jgi:peptide/nickel transport system permease protein
LTQAVLVVVGALLFNFLVIHLAPGDIVDVLAGEAGAANAEYAAALRERFGLDQPLVIQMLRYVYEVGQLDLGYSFHYSQPVLTLILARLGPTLLLMGTSLLIALVWGVLLGALAAARRNSLIDEIVSFVALLAYATPVFWIGLMMTVLFAVKLQWLPTGGMYDAAAGLTGFRHVLDVAHHIVLPAVTLSLFYFAVYTRLMRASMLEVFGMDFVRTAFAKGLPKWKITYKHVLLNAVLPIVTMAGMHFASLLGGAVLVETVFGWPGLGRLTYDAVFQRDTNMLLGILLLSSIVIVIVNFLVDLLYAWLDPRISLR